ncbi:DNA polymerase III alpha subunit [Clostridium botulinum B str. Osaka05]|uniref:DNA-directed DNA polymerase n=1 Tax=Clostridium botulinum B str. Osaka05 TaxID=1407017 RepID=A0A060N9D4_CLOBO|nr:PHP domain-containing protein [Clostridium botulinum]BAO04764.1 DNA polymerase III alpha subunit [Clostridium botulinum B str. Osaka05]
MKNNIRYNNYHKHTHYSNLRTLDVICKPIDYIKRARELRHTTYFTTEHGWGGNVWEAYSLCKENNLKMIFGVEAYYVDNRFEKDRSNYHIILIALNKEGYKDINRIISEANKTGYYYKPRIDLELLLSLNPKNVIITTACVVGRLRDKDCEEKFIIPVKDHFNKNFYLEVQSHKDQAEYNKKIMQLSKKYNIEIIHANDSHYILEEDSKYRDMFLQAKGIFYEDESSFILDYPTSEEIIDRYKKQGILNEDEIKTALKNTLIFDECEDLNFDKKIKIPKIHKEDSNKKLKEIINKEWKKEIKNINKKDKNKYLEAIRYEVDIVEKTHMEDYFILDYEIVKKAINKYNGVLTRTGRGSAPSFYINKLLGFTDIDRISAPITLYPTRFMSVTRILQTKSLPDIDMNWANIESVVKASKDILGEDGVYFMIAYKPLQNSSAFRLWCKAKGLNIKEYNEIAKNLEDYLEDEKWGKLIEESKVFRGVVESVAPSPCSFLLLDKPISEEVGLIKVGNEICCCLDGYNCDVYKYLKNDYLTVKVWKIISEVYKEINQPIDTIKQLGKKVDNKVWELYKKGFTATLNQADSNYATPLIKTYAPKSIAEISAWVASIRPGFASLMNNFLHRKSYSTGVKELDNLLQDSFHYMMYQESIMKYLVWLGISEDETYGIIKKIAKKKFKENELKALKEKLQEGWIKNVGSKDGFEETWQVVNDASKYSFNASHSLSVGIDSLYGAYLKVNYPLEYMTVVLNEYQGDVDETAKIINELPYFNIRLLPPTFGHSKSQYSYDKETNNIYKGVSSIKYMNIDITENLYELSQQNEYNNFIELLKDIKEKTSCNSKQLDILIKLNYFKDFGENKFLLNIVKYFELFYNRKQLKKDKASSFPKEIIKVIQNNSRETNKNYMDLNSENILNEVVKTLKEEKITIKEQIEFEKEYLGYIQTKYDCDKNLAIVLDIDLKYSPKITLYRLTSGQEIVLKMNKRHYNENPLDMWEIIKIVGIKKKNKLRKIDDKWEKVEGEYDLWLNNFYKTEVI